MNKFIKDLHVVPRIDCPIEIFGGNEGTVTLDKEPKAHKQTGHILIK